MKAFFLISCTIFLLYCSRQIEAQQFNGELCESDHLFQSQFKSQVAAVASDVRRIIDHVLSPGHVGKTYNSVAHFVDRFGARLTGTENLKNAIDYMVKRLVKEGHDNVHTENVTVPIWVSFWFPKFMSIIF